MITAKEVLRKREDYKSKQMQDFINSNVKGFEILGNIILQESKYHSGFETKILLNHEYQDYLSNLDLPRQAPSNLNNFIFDMYYHEKLNLFTEYLRSLGYSVYLVKYKK